MTEALISTDNAPEAAGSLDKMLSLSEVCAIEGVSRWTIRRRVREGKFPPGYELENGGVGWPQSVIRARRETRARRTYGAPVDKNDAQPAAAA